MGIYGLIVQNGLLGNQVQNGIQSPPPPGRKMGFYALVYQNCDFTHSFPKMWIILRHQVKGGILRNHVANGILRPHVAKRACAPSRSKMVSYGAMFRNGVFQHQVPKWDVSRKGSKKGSIFRLHVAK